MLQENEKKSIRRLGRSILYISCIFIIAIQIGELIFLQTNNPIVTKTEVVKKGIALPGVSFCYSIEEVDDLNSFSEKESNNQTFRQTFLKWIIYPDSHLLNCVIGNYSCAERTGNHHKWEEHIIFHSKLTEVCSTLVTSLAESSQEDVYIKIHLDQFVKLLTLIIHDKRHIPQEESRIPFENEFKSAAVSFTMKVESEMIEAISQEENRCNETETYDPNKVMEDGIYSNLMKRNDTCFPPWRPESKNICQSYEDLMRMRDIYNTIKETMPPPMQSCKKLKHKVTERYNYRLSYKELRLYVSRKFGVQAIIQDYRFSTLSFVADIGAILTIFGSYSMLAIISYIIEFTKKGVSEYIQPTIITRVATLICCSFFFYEEVYLLIAYIEGGNVLDFTYSDKHTVEIPRVSFCYWLVLNNTFQQSTTPYEPEYYKSLLLHPRDHILYCEYFGEQCNNDEGLQYKWKTEYNFATVCDTITLKQLQEGSSPAAMHININKDLFPFTELCVYLNHPDPLPRPFSRKGCHFKQTLKSLKHSIWFETKITDRFTMCIEKEEYEQCINKCWVKQFLSKNPVCDLPRKTYGQNLTHCKDMTEFLSLVSHVVDNDLFHLRFDRIVCGCGDPCYQKKYDTVWHKLLNVDKYNLEIVFISGATETIQEQAKQTFLGFLAQTGGLLGLILPWSVLDIFCFLVQLIKNACCQNGGRKHLVYKAITWTATAAAYYVVVHQLYDFFVSYQDNPTSSMKRFPGFTLEVAPAISFCSQYQSWIYDDQGQIFFCVSPMQCEVLNANGSINIEKMSDNIAVIENKAKGFSHDCFYYGEDCNYLIREGLLVTSVYISPVHLCKTYTWNLTVSRNYQDKKILFYIEDASHYYTDQPEVYIHTQSDLITPYYMRLYGLQPPLSQMVHESMSMKVSLRKYYYHDDCIARPDYIRDKCVDACINNGIEEELGCRLPWNTDSTFTDLCYNATDYKKAFEVVDNVTLHTVEQCNCLPPCEIEKYMLSPTPTEAVKLHPITLYIMDDPVYIDIYARYTPVLVVATIAGIFSLFTGDSFFDLFVKMGNIFRCIFNC